MGQQVRPHNWQEDNDLCDCRSGGHCLEGSFCPCLLVNKTHQLLEEHDDAKQGQPRNAAWKPSGCGWMGCAWCACSVVSGLGFIFGCRQRSKIRDRHGIDGSGCGDCMTNMCCPCCAVIQQYKELEVRREARVITQAPRPAQPMRR